MVCAAPAISMPRDTARESASSSSRLWQKEQGVVWAHCIHCSPAAGRTSYFAFRNSAPAQPDHHTTATGLAVARCCQRGPLKPGPLHVRWLEEGSCTVVAADAQSRVKSHTAAAATARTGWEGVALCVEVRVVMSSPNPARDSVKRRG